MLQTIDDPLSYAQKILEQMNAEAIKPGNKKKVVLNIDLDKKLEYSKPGQIISQSTALNIGYFYIHYFYEKMKLDNFFAKATADRKIQFDCNFINRFLTYAQILNPSSKLRTCQKTLPSFYERPQIAHQTILRFLDILYENYDAYISHLFKYSEKIVKRDTEVCYYDCTNFYFEIEAPDEDYYDEVTGEFINGFRKYGVSKEHRPNPIVEVGLFMDAKGIPISMCVHPGNTNEQITAIPEEKKLNRMFEGKSFVYCADAGLGSENIRTFNSMSSRSFVVTQSVKTLADKYKKAVFNDSEYKDLVKNVSVSIEQLKTLDKTKPENRESYESKAYKVFPADKVCTFDFYEEVKLKNGTTTKRKVKYNLKQYIIVTFSRKQMEYQRFIRNRQVERAKKLLENAKDPEDIKKGPNDVRRFIRRKTTSSNGNAVENIQDQYFIDNEKISEEEKYDGFYAVATNLPVMDENDKTDHNEVKHVMDILAVRVLIESLFRLMKSCFKTRPFYLRTTEHIIGHLMICYTALLLFRLIEVKLDEGDEDHFTSENILDTLKAMNIHYNDLYCEALYDRSKVLDALEGISGLGLDKQYYLPTRLNKLIKQL